MPAWLHDDSKEVRDYKKVEETSDEHKGHISHDVVIGAAAAYAAKKFQEHQSDKTGVDPKHPKAVEFAAGLGASFLTHLIETKGLDLIDKTKSKHEQDKQRKELEDKTRERVAETITVSDREEWAEVKAN